MKARQFDFYSKPARITVDEADTPEICEVYDPEQGALVQRNDLTLDVWDSHGSHLISEDEFKAL